jgi:redox-sensitive bicupin YhaK (pirin superfamily)
MGNKQTIGRGDAQYMSAGTGVWHSEYNLGKKPHRFFQIWILPDAKGHVPNYGDHRFAWEDRAGKWLPIASSVGNEDNTAAPIRIHQDINMYAAYLEAGQSLPLEVAPGRQAYLIVAEGAAKVGGVQLDERDAMEIVGESVTVQAGDSAHVVVIEMAQA